MIYIYLSKNYYNYTYIFGKPKRRPGKGIEKTDGTDIKQIANFRPVSICTVNVKGLI